MKKHKISFIICPNGFGHYVRCLNIIDSILKLKDYEINIFANHGNVKHLALEQ